MAFRPLSTQNSYKQNFGQINDMVRQLNKEQTVKTFKQPSGNAIINGKLPYDGGYGSLYYDTNGVPSIIIGIDPDGNVNIHAAKDGVDVISLFT